MERGGGGGASNPDSSEGFSSTWACRSPRAWARKAAVEEGGGSGGRSGATVATSVGMASSTDRGSSESEKVSSCRRPSKASWGGACPVGSDPGAAMPSSGNGGGSVPVTSSVGTSSVMGGRLERAMLSSEACSWGSSSPSGTCWAWVALACSMSSPVSSGASSTAVGTSSRGMMVCPDLWAGIGGTARFRRLGGSSSVSSSPSCSAARAARASRAIAAVFVGSGSMRVATSSSKPLAPVGAMGASATLMGPPRGAKLSAAVVLKSGWRKFRVSSAMLEKLYPAISPRRSSRSTKARW